MLFSIFFQLAFATGLIRKGVLLASSIMIYSAYLNESERKDGLLASIFHNSRSIPEAHSRRAWAYSPRYLGDMIHKATGGTAIGYIHSFVVERGKSLLMHGHNVSETAHLLGFGYTHHFNRIFKKVTGLTPSEFLAKIS